MFPFGRVIYMPITSPTTFFRPISTNFSTIPLYNTTFLSNPLNVYTTNKFKTNSFQTISPQRMKRTRDDIHDIQQKKRSKLTSTINNNDNSSTLTKNALMLLHELKPSIEYKLVGQTGPSHRPSFTMTVEVNGQIFEGIAQSKKEAKQAAAEKALRSLSDKMKNESIVLTTKIPINNVSNEKNIELNEISNDLSPLCLLNQLKRDAQFEEITDEITSEQREFKFAITIDNQRFIGTGRSKRSAKTKAAQLALDKLFGICFDKEIDTPIEIDNFPYSHREFSDRISIYIQEKFRELAQKDARLRRRKVLSAIVLTHNYNLETMEIICITTGTKYFKNDHSKSNGQLLNDCHGEILARRCLIRYIYEQLRLLIDDISNETIFEKIDNTERFRLKSSITFHLYISTIPCGDARLFSLEDISSTNLNRTLKKSSGLLRRKVEACEGTIPILARIVYQNLPISNEILNSERYSTMSCSDKLCRWNFIGLQGALLSVLIDPIYYTSIIIGNLYHSEHIRWALFSRIEDIVTNIPAPYGFRRPFISGVSNPEVRSTARAPNNAFIWNSIDKKCEIIDTLHGLTTSHESSMISKTSLFQQWINLMSKIKSETIPTIYRDAKQLAIDYQMAKSEVNKAFLNAGLGPWMSKTDEQDQFDISSSCQTNDGNLSINSIN